MSEKFNMKRKILNVRSTFIKARLREEIFVARPNGFGQTGGHDYVYLLQKALYGLCQSSQEWIQNFYRFMVGFGFVQYVTDPTVNFWVDTNWFAVFVVYVDDVFICYSEESVAVEVVPCFEREFEVHLDAPVERFLGFTVEESGDLVKLHNVPMVLRLLNRFCLMDCKVTDTPLPVDLDLASE